VAPDIRVFLCFQFPLGEIFASDVLVSIMPGTNFNIIAVHTSTRNVLPSSSTIGPYIDVGSRKLCVEI
jgi:hypothetical protein